MVGSVLLAYPSLRAARTLLRAQAAALDEQEFFTYLIAEMGQISVSWAVKLYWMLSLGFLALFLAAVFFVFDAIALPAPW